MKPWYESKTIWINLIVFLIAVIGLFVDSNLFDQYDQYLIMAIAVLNLVLRYFFTSTKIE